MDLAFPGEIWKVLIVLHTGGNMYLIIDGVTILLGCLVQLSVIFDSKGAFGTCSSLLAKVNSIDEI